MAHSIASNGVSHLSVWPLIICAAAVYAFAATPLLRAADTPPGATVKRDLALDGLRGALALAVVFHHGAIYHGYLRTGVWDSPPSNLYTGLGEGGVSMFFMVTGYLFWRKVLAEQGRGGINWFALAIGRVFRIAPVYWLTMALTLVAVASLTRWTLNEPMFLLVGNIAQMLSLGVFRIPEVNRYSDIFLILAGVTWSLWYEWAFYLALPFLALVLRLGSTMPALRGVMPWLLPGIVFVGCVAAAPKPHNHAPTMCAALFCVGMLAAAVGPVRVGSDRMRSIAVLLLVTAALVAFRSSFEVGPVLLLGAAFTLIASGCTVFGALTSRPAVRVGDVSYGIYLLQGLTLAAVYWPSPLSAFARSGPVAHWLLFLLSTLALVIISTAAHVYIERPGIAAGRWTVRYLQAHAMPGRQASATRSTGMV